MKLKKVAMLNKYLWIRNVENIMITLLRTREIIRSLSRERVFY